MRRVKATVAHVALCVLVALGLVFGVAHPALASTSTEMSDDGEDYGWLYRKGDVLYSIDDPENPLLYFYKDKWYSSPGEHDLVEGYSCFGLSNFLYRDGTLSFQVGGQVCLSAVLRWDGTFSKDGTRRWSYISQVTEDPGYAMGYAHKHPRVPYLIGGIDGPLVVKHVYIDDDVVFALGGDDIPRAGYNSYQKPVALDHWFEGFENVEDFEGLGNVPTDEVTTMAHMFYGCAKVEELDISGFDTSSCTDFGEMFEGCVSLVTLKTGEKWTQEGAREALAGNSETTDGAETDTGGESMVTSVNDGVWTPPFVVSCGDDAPYKEADELLATFPVAMKTVIDGEEVRFETGEVIPDGAATYTAADPVYLKDVAKTLVAPDGSTWTDGVDAELMTCEYTGDPVEPDVVLTVGEATLQRDVDYTVSYRNNVEDGEAEAVLTGINGVHGRVIVPFRIVDTGAYAFLYDDGLLYLKAAHGLPSTTVVSSTKAPKAIWRWFDAATEEPGASVPWEASRGKVRRVVVDPSFASVSPTTMAGWFEGCATLEGVEGLANVDASRASSLAGLFRGCARLGELDLSGLKTSGVADFSGLASGCSSLERLVLGDLDLAGAKAAAGPLDGCGALNEVVCGEGFRNAELASARLALPKEAYRTSPGYARAAAGSAVPDGAGTYRLRNLALQLCTVEMDKDAYTCTGKPIKPRMTVRLGKVTLREGADYAVAYEDNVYPGNVTPKATITGRGVFSGGLVVPFRIVSRVTQVGDRLVIRNKTGTFVVRVTKVSKNGKAAEVAVVSVEAAPGIRSMVLPSECTVGNVKVSVTTVSSKLTGRFRNVTSVVIGAKVTTIGAKAFSKATKVRTLVVKSARLKTVKNCLSGSRVTKVKTKVSLSSTKRRTYKRWFTSRSTVGKSVTYSYG